MNRWLQTRIYACRACGAQYVHDKGHHHAVFECPNRPMPTLKPVPVAKVYRPEAGR